MSSATEAADLVERVVGQWREPKGLIAALTLCVLLGAVLPLDPLLRGAVAVGMSVGATLLWLWGRRLPKASKTRVGIAVSLSSSERLDERQFAEDFISELRQLLSRSSVGHSFQVIVAPRHISRKLASADAQELGALRTKMHCAYLLAGSVRVRKLEGKDHLVLDLAGAVGHTPISPDVQKRFAAEFGELLPRRIAMPSDQDLLAFTVTGAWMTVVAHYVIGIAAALSGDLDYAAALYQAAAAGVAQGGVDNPAATKIRVRLPYRMAELHEARANSALLLWRDTRSSDAAEAIKKNLEAIDQNLLSGRRYTYLRAIAAFLVDRDVEASIALLEHVKAQADATWYWNMGFLLAYKGDLKRASQFYRNGALLPVPPDIPAQLEEFIEAVLAEEPNRTQLHYCLGLLNRDLKGDEKRAIEEFTVFLEKTPDGTFDRDKDAVRKWLDDLRRTQTSE